MTVLKFRNHEGQLGRLEVPADATLADLRDQIVEMVQSDFLPGEDFDFQYLDEEENEMVQIFRSEEPELKALDFRKKRLTLLGAKRRKTEAAKAPAVQGKVEQEADKVPSLEGVVGQDAAKAPSPDDNAASMSPVNVKIENTEVDVPMNVASATSTTSPTGLETSDDPDPMDSDDEKKPPAVVTSMKEQNSSVVYASSGDDGDAADNTAEAMVKRI